MALVEIQRRLDLPVAEETLDRLAASAAEKHAGYTLRSWSGPGPRGAAPGVGRGDLGADDRGADGRDRPRARGPPTPPSSARPRPWPSSRAASSTPPRRWTPTGTVVAYTNFGVNTEGSPRAYQWGTLVRREHRGHRLGLAVKVANLRLLQAARPDLGQVVTWNAEVNTHMIGVNEEMGFVPVERSGEVQKKLA